jgi:hypothetical protein
MQVRLKVESDVADNQDMSTSSDMLTRPSTTAWVPMQDKSSNKSLLRPKNLVTAVALSVEAGVTLSLVLQSLTS